MNRKQIDSLAKVCPIESDFEDAAVIETHISWVLLSDLHAYKIKRPEKYSFLDFSTLEKRRYYCEREVELNCRTAPDMYKGVWPVTQHMLGTGENSDAVADYAVHMRRMDNDLEMDTLLRRKKVRDLDIVKLAGTIARFHSNAEVVREPFDAGGFQKQYNDIRSVQSIVKKLLGDTAWNTVEHCLARSEKYLNAHRDYFNDRVVSGFRRDCHGDLKACNIFLYDEPVIFDCIEFNDSYRQIDVLNDIAFLCVDLDFYKSRLGDVLYQSYIESFGTKDDDETRRRWMYYKSYRANIRAKVAAIGSEKTQEASSAADAIKRYLDLMHLYTQSL
jgi:aminoglycoside phosphotransferase family enzyme